MYGCLDTDWYQVQYRNREKHLQTAGCPKKARTNWPPNDTLLNMLRTAEHTFSGTTAHMSFPGKGCSGKLLCSHSPFDVYRIQMLPTARIIYSGAHRKKFNSSCVVNFSSLKGLRYYDTHKTHKVPQKLSTTVHEHTQNLPKMPKRDQLSLTFSWRRIINNK